METCLSLSLSLPLCLSLLKKCEHNLSKPEFNPTSIKFKIQLVAVWVLHCPPVFLHKYLLLISSEEPAGHPLHWHQHTISFFQSLRCRSYIPEVRIMSIPNLRHMKARNVILFFYFLLTVTLICALHAPLRSKMTICGLTCNSSSHYSMTSEMWLLLQTSSLCVQL